MIVALITKVHTLQFTVVLITPSTHAEAFSVPSLRSFSQSINEVFLYLWLYQK